MTPIGGPALQSQALVTARAGISANHRAVQDERGAGKLLYDIPTYCSPHTKFCEEAPENVHTMQVQRQKLDQSCRDWSNSSEDRVQETGVRKLEI